MHTTVILINIFITFNSRTEINLSQRDCSLYSRNTSLELKNSNTIQQENGSLIKEVTAQSIEHNEKSGSKANIFGIFRHNPTFNSSRRSSRIESNGEQIPDLIRPNFLLGNFFHSFQSKNLSAVHL